MRWLLQYYACDSDGTIVLLLLGVIAGETYSGILLVRDCSLELLLLISILLPSSPRNREYQSYLCLPSVSGVRRQGHACNDSYHAIHVFVLRPYLITERCAPRKISSSDEDKAESRVAASSHPEPRQNLPQSRSQRSFGLPQLPSATSLAGERAERDVTAINGFKERNVTDGLLDAYRSSSFGWKLS